MPLEIGIDFPDQKQIVKIQLKEKYGIYRIKVDQKPLKIVFDPNLWVLMNSNYEVPYQAPESYGTLTFIR
jgi:hypothetical protein